MSVLSSRREFVSRAALAGAAAFCLPKLLFAAEASAPRPRMKLALTPGSIGVRADQRESLALAHQYGFDAVEPNAEFLAGLGDSELSELLGDMQAKHIGAENMGCVLDSWHWWTAGETDRELLTLHATDVVSVDLNDAPAGIPLDQQQDGKRELPCATGVIPVGRSSTP